MFCRDVIPLAHLIEIIHIHFEMQNRPGWADCDTMAAQITEFVYIQNIDTKSITQPLS